MLRRQDIEEPARGAISAANHVPPSDGTNGYTATRWASERILERSAVDLGVPSFVYRFAPTVTQERAPEEVLKELVRCVDATSAIPDASGWVGRLDMIPAEQMARWLCEATLDNNNNNTKGSNSSTQFTHYEGRMTVTDAEMTAYIEQQRGDQEGLERVPLLQWIGRIKKAGFGFFLVSHEATLEKSMDGQEGAKLELKR